ncbi:MAG: IS66 family transposase zinc-finger binding domain-containing protein [Spirochaetes bacterium]|nr:IS66 family transposase zinc-finger binding domain-containing protein [Spirochaetota bacterium]
MTDSPEEIIKLSVNECPCCNNSLHDVEAKNYDKRQEFDTPKISVHVTEYQAEIKECPNCGSEGRANFPDGITHKT